MGAYDHGAYSEACGGAKVTELVRDSARAAFAVSGGVIVQTLLEIEPSWGLVVAGILLGAVLLFAASLIEETQS